MRKWEVEALTNSMKQKTDEDYEDEIIDYENIKLRDIKKKEQEDNAKADSDAKVSKEKEDIVEILSFKAVKKLFLKINKSCIKKII